MLAIRARVLESKPATTVCWACWRRGRPAGTLYVCFVRFGAIFPFAFVGASRGCMQKLSKNTVSLRNGSESIRPKSPPPSPNALAASTAGICTQPCICTVRRSGEAAREPTAAAAETLEGAGGGRNGVSPLFESRSEYATQLLQGAGVREIRERARRDSESSVKRRERERGSGGGRRARSGTEQSSGAKGRRREAAQAIDRLVVRRE